MIRDDVSNASLYLQFLNVPRVPLPSRPTTPGASFIQSILLFTVAIIGGGGNVCVIALIIAVRKFRRSAATFLAHQSFIDTIKSAYCVIFASGLIRQKAPEHCNVVGVSYIIFTTASAYNLLALVINEEFQLIRQRETRSANQSHCCIVFGVGVVWFTSFLINLGVAFLPGNPEYNADIGSCVFRYGIPRNLVLHSLWMVLVTGAVVLSYVWLILLYGRIKNGFQKHRVVPVCEEQRRLDRAECDQSCDSDSDDLTNHNLPSLQLHRRRVVVFIFMVTTFVLFWYPLFFLTICDPHYRVEPKRIYQVLTMLAWSQPILTPLFSVVILHDMGQSTSGGVHQLFIFHNQLPAASPTLSPHYDLTNSGRVTGSAMNLHAPQLLALPESSSIGTPTSVSDIHWEQEPFLLDS